ncbi:MAG: lysophospholipid acyltransferase family protein [Bacillota bacterium]
MEKNKNINDIKIRKPNGFLYYTITYLLKFLAKILFRMKINKKGIKGVKGPFVVVGNHSSVTDIVFTVSALAPHRLNVVTSRDLFTWPKFKPFINKLGCIPKSQFAIDIQSIKMMKAAVEQGRNIVLYPEGKTSIEGKQLHYLPPSIAKLLKFLNVPVIMSYTEGAYLTKPRYFKGFRYGKVKVTESVLFTQDDITKLSRDEIYERISQKMKFNDNIYQIENRIKFRNKKIAKGIEYILYRCPKCSKDYIMRSTEKNLICDYCGNNVEYNEYGQLKAADDISISYDRIDLWYDYQRECVDQEIKKPDFFISKKVDMLEERDRNFHKVGEGELYIDKEYIGYKGKKEEKPFEVKTPLKTLHTIITKNQEGVDLSYPEGFYRFLFKDKKGSTKYGIIVEQMFRMLNKLDEKE